MAAAALAVRAVDLDDLDTPRPQMSSEARSIRACPFHAYAGHLTEMSEPLQGASITGWCGGERLDSELNPVLIERGDDVHVTMRVDPAGD
jgi:hypothetical protein